VTASLRRPPTEPARQATFGLSTLAEPYYLPDGRLTFAAPPGAYAAIPAWHSANAWLGAAKLHPRLDATCHGRIAVPTFLAVLRILAEHANVETGRDIAVAYSTVGELAGRCEKTIQRACRVAEELGLLARVLDGADMSLGQRVTVLSHFSRGARGAKWRSLPNFYAATMPRPVVELITQARSPKPVRGSDYAWSVDNSGSPPVHGASPTLGNVRLPVGSTGPLIRSIPLNSRTTTFGTACAEPARSAKPKTNRTAASRPTKPHQRTGADGHPPRLDPAVERFARTLRSTLPGYQGISLRRICPALTSYVSGGLSPSDILHGLDGYLAAVGRTWLTAWRPDQQAEQASYLIGMITAARRAGYILLGL